MDDRCNIGIFQKFFIIPIIGFILLIANITVYAQPKAGTTITNIASGDFYDEQGNLIKTYSSIAKAERDTGIQYYKIKQLLKEGKLWKLA